MKTQEVVWSVPGGMGWRWGDFIASMVNLHGVSTLQEKSSGERGVQQRAAQQAANIRDTVNCDITNVL